jgi:hypothetical protein
MIDPKPWFVVLGVVLLASTDARADELPEDLTPPKVALEAIDTKALATAPAKITVKATADDPDSGVREVTLKVDGTVMATVAQPPFAEAKNHDGKTASASLDVTVGADAKVEPGAAATGAGCSQSATPRTVIGSGVAFALALFAGVMLRRQQR